MQIKQLSVFVENTQGRLADITAKIAEANIDIRALSLADTTDFGILRLIVDKPEEAVLILKESGLTVSLTNVIAIGIDDTPGGFAKAVRVLANSDISIEYLYAFVSRSDNLAYVILRVEDNDKAVKVLTEGGIPVVGQGDIFSK